MVKVKNKPKKWEEAALSQIRKEQHKTTVAISKIAFARYVHIHLLTD